MKHSRISNYQEILLLGLNKAFEGYAEAEIALKKARLIADSTSSEALNELVTATRSIEISRVALVLFSASYVEALINAYMSITLKPDEFAALDRLSPLDKWAIAPRMVDQGYRLKKGSSPHQELTELFKRRNAIVHHKPTYEENGIRVHQGEFPPIHSDEEGMVHKFRELPEKLLTMLSGVGDGSHAMMLAFSSGLSPDVLARIRNGRM